MTGAPLVFLDIESTGLDPRFHEPWEIAVITRDDNAFGGVTETEYVFHVKPNLYSADLKALEINRFYERTKDIRPYRPGGVGPMWRDPEPLARELAYLLHGRHIVALNPAFDAAMLTRFLLKNGQAPTWHYHLIDVGAPALGFLHGQNSEREYHRRDLLSAVKLPWHSDHLARDLGVTPPDEQSRHTALADARMVRDMFDVITGVATPTSEGKTA